MMVLMMMMMLMTCIHVRHREIHCGLPEDDNDLEYFTFAELQAFVLLGWLSG